MPIFDRWCETCGWQREDVFEPVTLTVTHCPSGHETARGYLRGGRTAAIHGDDGFIGGRTYENLGHRPVTVYSRSELKRELTARGLQEFVRHVGEPGSDKSKRTTRWI